MPRTTIDIDASVLKELKRRKQRDGKTVGQLVSELLAAALAGREVPRVEPAPWIAKDLRPRMDLEDKEALNAVLDER